MPELQIPKGLTPEQEQELKQNFHNDQASKQEQPNQQSLPQANA